MEPGLDYGEVYSAWMATTLDTLAATLDSVGTGSAIHNHLGEKTFGK